MKEAIGHFDNSLTLGFDYYRVNANIRQYPRFDLEKKNTGVYVHDEFSITDKLMLSADYRWDQANYKLSAPGPTRSSMNYDAKVFSAGVNYRLLDRSNVYFSFAQGFRYPIPDELFDLTNNRINLALKLQTTDNYKLSVRHAFTDNLYGNLNLFRLDTSNELTYFPLKTHNKVSPRTRRVGVEITPPDSIRGASACGGVTPIRTRRS